MPSPAFSGSATLRATVQQNIKLTKSVGEEPLEPAQIICGLFYLFFLSEIIFLLSFYDCYISLIDIVKCGNSLNKVTCIEKERQRNM